MHRWIVMVFLSAFVGAAPTAAQLLPSCPAAVQIPTRELIAAFRECGNVELAAEYEQMLAPAPAPLPTAPPPETEEAFEARVADLIRPPPIDRSPHPRRLPITSIRRVPRYGLVIYELPHFTATVHEDGSVTFEDRTSPRVDAFFSSGGSGGTASGGPTLRIDRFDLTDLAMRLAGINPYEYERTEFLEAVEPLTAELDLETRLTELDQALRRLPRRLEGIWTGIAASAAGRREALFEEWDDCADDEWGREARNIIVVYIRARLPAGTAEAFTAAEIRRFNAARLSTEAFQPY